MKKIALLLLLFTIINCLKAHQQEKPFVIITCSYNNKKWYKFNLHSIFRQWYSNYRVIYIDDNSTDGTGKAIQDYVQQKKQTTRFTYIKNNDRLGACANTCQALLQCADHEIAVILDGDDWFECPNALQELNKIYSDSNIWMTYGEFRYWPSEKLPQDLDRRPLNLKNFDRKTMQWRILYPRTFYTKLFRLIPQEDLMFEDTFLPMAADVGYMLPMLEMCGERHAKYCKKILAYYNRGTPINDNKVNKQLQKSIEKYIREKSPYQPLEHLW